LFTNNLFDVKLIHHEITSIRRDLSKMGWSCLQSSICQVVINRSHR